MTGTKPRPRASAAVQYWRERTYTVERCLDQTQRLYAALRAQMELMDRVLCAIARENGGSFELLVPDDTGEIFLAPADRFGRIEVTEMPRRRERHVDVDSAGD